jgi:hypothetical protein
MIKKLSSFNIDLIVIVTILILGLIFSFGLENVIDIGLYDESSYLLSGVQVWNVGLPVATKAPLYAIWYFILSFFQPNRIILYYLNYKLTLILPPALVYGLLRKSKVSLPISLIISQFILISHANVDTWPRVSHFALILLLTTLILLGQEKIILWNSLVAQIGALLVSYVRPEYFLAYILFTLLFTFLIIRDYKKLEKRYLSGLLAGELFSILLLVGIGLPIGERSMVAFGQHFSLHWVSWNNSAINPWTNWVEIISRNFGTVNSIPEAFAKNPSMFLKHIAYNFLDLAKSAPKLFIPRLSINVYEGALIALLSICLVAYLYNNHRKNLLTDIRNNFQENKILLLFIGLFLLPGFISIVIIYPRPHYLLIMGILAILGAIILFRNPNFKQEQISYKVLFLLCTLLIILTLQFSPYQKIVNKPNLNTIQFIQSLNINQPVNMLEAQGGFYIYLNGEFDRVAEYDKNTNFDQFRTDRNISMIVLSDILLNDTRFINDTEWQGFLADYDKFGYIQLEIPNTNRKLILQADLLYK